MNNISSVGLKNSSASKKDVDWGEPASAVPKKVDAGWGNNDMDDLLDDFAGTKKSNNNELNDASRNSGGAYSGFGILGKNSAINKSGSN